MTTKYLPVPTELQPSVDALVKAAHEGAHFPSGPAFEQVTRWCAANSDASGLESGDYGASFLVVSLDEGLVDEVEDEIDVQGLTRGTAERRVAAAVRQRLIAILEGDGDIDPYPHACGIRLKAGNGQTAILAYFLSGGGYEGAPDVSWHGVYAKFTEFRAEIRGSGGLTSKTDVRRLPNSVLIDLVRRHASAGFRASPNTDTQ